MLQLAPMPSPRSSRAAESMTSPPPGRARGQFQRDRDRIVHLTAFRRPEYKTQVFVNHEGDLFRTRLTHSIEVGGPAHLRHRARARPQRGFRRVDRARPRSRPHPSGHAGQDASTPTA